VSKKTAIGDIRDTDGGSDVPNVRNEDESGDVAGERRDWILQRLEESHELQAPAVAKHFNCSVKTVHRDLRVLKDDGIIEFVGAPRTGYYRLKDPSDPGQQSS